MPVPVPVKLAAFAALFACHPSPRSPAPPPPPKVLQLNAPGALVDLSAHLTPGYVTIVDFWADWCGACADVDAAITAAIADHPRILLRRVDVGDGDTPVARAYDAGALPYVHVYDHTGALRYALRFDDAFTAGDRAVALLP